MEKTEIWEKIPSHPKHEASSQGRIRHARSKRVRKPKVLRNGYLSVNLSTENRRSVHITVHRLVAMAFHGMPEPGQVVRHIDGNKRNNTPENLAWGTPRENYDDLVRHGSMAGDRHPMRRLTEATAVVIVSRVRAGESRRTMAVEYGVSYSTIKALCSGQNWARFTHVVRPPY